LFIRSVFTGICYILITFLELWHLTEGDILADSTAYLNLHVFVKFSIEVASVGEYDDEVDHEEYQDDEEHGPVRQTAGEHVWRWEVVLLLESMALSWLVLERSADGLEGVIWGQSSLEGHTVDHKLWVQLTAESTPVFCGISEQAIVSNFMILSRESLINTALNHFFVDSQFGH
jgi:hypothetical protein